MPSVPTASVRTSTDSSAGWWIHCSIKVTATSTLPTCLHTSKPASAPSVTSCTLRNGLERLSSIPPVWVSSPATVPCANTPPTSGTFTRSSTSRPPRADFYLSTGKFLHRKNSPINLISTLGKEGIRWTNVLVVIIVRWLRLKAQHVSPKSRELPGSDLDSLRPRSIARLKPITTDLPERPVWH